MLISSCRKEEIMKNYESPRADLLLSLSEEVMTDTSLTIEENYNYDNEDEGGIVIEFN